MENPFIGILGVSSITPMALLVAGDQHLRGQIDIRPLRLTGYLYPVGNGRSGGEGPTTATVNGDVLISLDSQVVGTIDIAPPEVRRQLREGHLGKFFKDMRLKSGRGTVVAIERNVDGLADHQQ